METNRTELALLPDRAYIPRSQMVFNASVHTPQYTVHPTALGEYALHFTADWLCGMFSITDLSPEWVSFIQHQVRGGWSEGSYSGAAPFSNVVWDSTPWDDRVAAWVFSQVQVSAKVNGGILGDVLDSIRGADVSTWDQSARELPFHKTLALPDVESTTLGNLVPSPGAAKDG